MLWAVATLGFRPSHTLLQRYLFSCYVALPRMRPQELANLAWAVASMRVRPGRAWLRRLTQCLAQQAPALKPQELANSAWALSQLLDSSSPPAATTDGTHHHHHHQEGAAGRSNVGEAQQQQGVEEPGRGHQDETEEEEGLWCALAGAAHAQAAQFSPSELMMALMALRKHLHRRQPRFAAAAATQPQRSGAGGAWRRAWGAFDVLLRAAVGHLAPRLALLPTRDACHLACMVAWSVQQHGQEGSCLSSSPSATTAAGVGGAARQVPLKQQQQGDAVAGGGGGWDSAGGRTAVRQLCRAVEARTAGRMAALDAEVRGNGRGDARLRAHSSASHCPHRQRSVRCCPLLRWGHGLGQTGETRHAWCARRAWCACPGPWPRWAPAQPTPGCAASGSTPAGSSHPRPAPVTRHAPPSLPPRWSRCSGRRPA